MNNKAKRLAILLCGAMLTSQLSFPAYAEENIFELEGQDTLIEDEEEQGAEAEAAENPVSEGYEFSEDQYIDTPKELSGDEEKGTADDLIEEVLFPGETDSVMGEDTMEYAASGIATVTTQEQFLAAWNAGDPQTKQNVVIKVGNDIDLTAISLLAKPGVNYAVDAVKPDGGRYVLEGIQISRDNEAGGEVDPEIVINADVQFQFTITGKMTVLLTGNISCEEGFSYAAEVSEAEVTVEGDVTSSAQGIDARDSSSVTIKGDLTVFYDGIRVQDGASVTVSGDVSCYRSSPVHVFGMGQVTILGNVFNPSRYDGIYADGSGARVVVQGNVSVSDESDGNTRRFPDASIEALNGAVITVGGDVEGISNIYTGAENSTVHVLGDVKNGWIIGNGGSVSVEGDVGCESNDEWALRAYGSKITVGGSLTAHYGAILESGSPVVVGGDINVTEIAIIICGNGELKVGGNVVSQNIGLAEDVWGTGRKYSPDIQVEGFLYAKNYAFYSWTGITPADPFNLSVSIGKCVRTDGQLYGFSDKSENPSCTFENFKDNVTWGEHEYEIVDQDETAHVCVCSVCGAQKTEEHYGGTATCTDAAECEVCGEEYEPALGHKLTKIPEKKATCTEDGHDEYWKCSVCGLLFGDEDGEDEIDPEDVIIKAAGHEETVIKKAKQATYKEDGYTGDVYCNDCGARLKSGHVVPALIETAEQLQANNNAINTKLNAAWSGKSIKVTWGKVNRADGYDIFAEKCGVSLTSKKLVKTVGKGSTVSAKISKISGTKLNSRTTYKFRVRAWRMVNGKKKYIATSLTVHVAGKNSGKYTNVKKLKTTKSSYTLTKDEKRKLSVQIVKQSKAKKLLSEGHTRRLRYWSTNQKVAVVNEKGMITAKGKGQCYIYIISANGVKKRVRITVN